MFVSMFDAEPVKTRYEAERVMEKYPGRIPVLVHKNPNSTNTPEIDKHKYLVPMELTIGQLMFVIRKRLKLHPEKALFLFVDNEVACNSHLISSVYDRSQNNADGFLHVIYSCENTFGVGETTFLATASHIAGYAGTPT
jgi:GABA(A) receptor-associated protein